jgi:hypothetical protein
MLQLAVRDKVIQRQQSILIDHELDGKVGYAQLALLEQTLMYFILHMQRNFTPSS